MGHTTLQQNADYVYFIVDDAAYFSRNSREQCDAPSDNVGPIQTCCI